MSAQAVTCICEVIFSRSVLSQGGDSPEQHGDYWEAVSQFVLQGRVDLARNLLRLHHGPVHLARRAAAQDAALQHRLLCNSALIKGEGVYVVAARLRQCMQTYNRESRRTSKDDCASGRHQPSFFNLL